MTPPRPEQYVYQLGEPASLLSALSRSTAIMLCNKICRCMLNPARYPSQPAMWVGINGVLHTSSVAELKLYTIADQ